MTETSPSHDVPVTEPPAAPSVATFSLRRAAELTGLSVSTLRRRRSELEAAGARVTDQGWEVPITALEAVGMIGPQKAASRPQEAPPEPEAPGGGDALDEALERVRELEAELLEARHRAELAEVRQAAAEQRARAAEVLADDRGRTLEIERRMLLPGPSAYAQAPSMEPAPEAPPQQERTRQETPSQTPGEHRPSWWKRTFS